MSIISILTPTYNRAYILPKLFQALCVQSCKDFVWLIVDDGSTDDTRFVVEGYIAEQKMDIQYHYQQNQGKHIAINYAVEMTESELFVIADSDDAFTADALEKLVAAWDSIPDARKPEFKGVICRCFDSKTGLPIGKFPQKTFDGNDLDANFKYKLNFEKWLLLRTDVLREFPFPGEGMGLKFFPETVVWRTMARKYKNRYIDDPLREYFRDQDNALTHAKTPRFRENTFLWANYVNDIMDYFWYNPFVFLKAFVGLSRDNILVGKSFGQIMAIPNKFWKKVVCALFYPAGWILSLRFNKNR